ncbi:hypothetical protein F4859DRAFT_507020 [Xylaria cf. heliscus]|nr:hypothetical protein F4859DRAFT_507020 [Xylaria cf. heliscus]
MAGPRVRQLLSRVRKERRRLENTFGGIKGWELERFLGHGLYGITVLLKDSDPLHLRKDSDMLWVPNTRRVVLKWALFPELGTQDFDTEIKVLKRLRGKAHHAQMIASTTDVAHYRPVFFPTVNNMFRRLIAPFKNPPTNIFKILRGSRGPAILLEYIAFGNLQHLSSRARARNINFPNRIIWSFYFCLVRACVGLHYPHDVFEPGDGPLVLETITRPEPNGLTHNDIALRNIMVDRPDWRVREHRIMPRLKLIDYGMSETIRNGRRAATENLFWVAISIMLLINPDAGRGNDNAVTYNGILTYATNILPQLGGNDNFPYLDPDLRQLLAEAMAVNVDLRPSIEDVFRRTQAGKDKTAADYVLRPDIHEDDATIDRLFQRLIFDADDN